MNLDEALALTAPQTRNKSHVAILLDALEGDKRDAVLAALRSNHEAAHLARALTKMAHAIEALPADKSVAAQAVRDWRAANGPR
jgi:hypothetical protein